MIYLQHRITHRTTLTINNFRYAYTRYRQVSF